MIGKRGNKSETFATGPKQKFRPSDAKLMIRDVLKQELEGKSYPQGGAPNEVQAILKSIADNIKKKLTQVWGASSRYKFVVQVIFGEFKGQGIKSGSRCFWDTETDNCAWDQYISKDASGNVFCLASAFAIYLY